jgi:hypothetical protein
MATPNYSAWLFGLSGDIKKPECESTPAQTEDKVRRKADFVAYWGKK